MSAPPSRLRSTVNGEACELDGWLGTRLLDFLRQGLGLTGSKEGCSEGECGACTVLLDGDPVCSCLILADMAVGADVRTVEGVDRELLEAMTAAVDEVGGVQCGYCIPGFVVMTQWLSDHPDPPDVPHALEGNLCRCTGYTQLHEVIGGLTSRAPAGSSDGRHD